MSWQDIVDLIRDNKRKAVAILVSLFYLSCFIFSGHWGDGLRILGCLAIPLSLIFFSEALGNYKGPVGKGRYIDQTTPAGIIEFFGWLILLIPAVLYLITHY